ncbi:MAG: amidohydrolase family protein [Acidimicrobiales bacterium]
MSNNTDTDTWLATTVETPVDPNQEICDPHHHLWDHPESRYLLHELRADTGAGHNVTSTVFVECMSGYRTDGPEALRPVGETDFVAAIASESDRTADSGAVIAGIVGYADLTLGDEVDAVLEAHEEAGQGRFRGIRHAATWDPSPDVHNGHTRPPEGLLTDETFGRGLATLARRGHSFDAWVYHPQLGDVTAMARQHPDLPIVLDHLGGPIGVGPYAGRRDEVLDEWRPAMHELASCPNVTVKLGGIGMALYGMGWHRNETAPTSEQLEGAWGDAVRWCIEAFGPERCMFESNFPVDKRSCSYTVLWNTFQRIAAEASADERQLLFHDTARRFYRVSTDR